MKSVISQSILFQNVRKTQNAEIDQEPLRRLIQQRAFLRSLNRTAFDELVKLSHDLTAIRVAVGMIRDFMQQAIHALKVETAIVLQQNGCGADLHDVSSRLLVNLLEAQERWSPSALNNPPGNDAMLVNASINTDFELTLVESFFAAQNIGTRLQSHLRDLIRSLLEIYSPRGLTMDPRSGDFTSVGGPITSSTANSPSSFSPTSGVLASRDIFQPISASELLATVKNATACRRAQTVFKARTSLLGERASTVVGLIERLNARLHTLTAENRETRAYFTLAQSSFRQKAPISVTRYVSASIFIAEVRSSAQCFTPLLQPMGRFDQLIGIITSTLGLWISLIALIEMHWRHVGDQRRQISRLNRIPLGIRNPSEHILTNNNTSPIENHTGHLPEMHYEPIKVPPKEILQPKMIRINNEDPQEMWLSVPPSLLEMAASNFTGNPMIYRESRSSKTIENRGSLLNPLASSSSSSTHTFLDKLQNRF